MKRVYNMKSGRWRTIHEDKAPIETKEEVVEFKGIPENYRELQELAKSLEIPANQSKEELIQAINDYLSNK
jgi:hypothetical protein